MRRFIRHLRHLPWLAAMLAGPPAALAGTSTTIITGIDYSRGDYGDSETTEMVYLPLTIKYRHFPWTTKVTIPWLTITGPESVTAGSGTVLTGRGNNGTTATDSGLGDVTASLGFALDTLWQTSGKTFVDLTAKIKLPTADADARLGTGETDYQILLDVAHAFDTITPFATFGYKWMGDTADTDYNDVFSLSLGADKRLSRSISSGLILDWMAAVTDDSDPRREWMAYINWRVSPRMSINLYGVAGFSDASPDQSIGLQFVFKQF